MLSSFLPLSYLSPLRSLTGASRSRDTRPSTKGVARDPPSGYCSNLQHGNSHISQRSSMTCTCDTLISNNSGVLPHGLQQDVSTSAPLPAPPSSPKIKSLSLSSLSQTSICSIQDPPMLFGKPHVYSCLFPLDHQLNTCFLQNFRLEEELGAGGYGFVMAASRRTDNKEVAVKFIIKNKVPEHAWTQDSALGRIPTEVLLLTLVDHPYIAKCLDLYEDNVYYYLVQEIHGSPWISPKYERLFIAGNLSAPELVPSSSSESTVNSDSDSTQSTSSTSRSGSELIQRKELLCYGSTVSQQDIASLDEEAFAARDSFIRPSFPRRPSHDLFECIEQSPHKRLSESRARYVFAQVVDAVYYLDCQGITHCDIKDENILVDTDFKVKLIDFGSAVVADPTKPAPFYNLFFGTAAYASSEVLQRKPYRAAPAEVWALGVLLSYLLTGSSPFPTEQDAIAGKVVTSGEMKAKLSKDALGIMKMCLEPDPEKRAIIKDVSEHRWLDGALDG